MDDLGYTTISDQPSIVWINSQKLRPRIDATYYSAQYLDLDEKITSKGLETGKLGSFLVRPHRQLYLKTQTYEEGNDNRLRFISGVDIDENSSTINWDNTKYVDRWMLDEYPKGELFPGALLIQVKGLKQLAAFVEKVKFPALVSGSILFGGVKNNIDPFYLSCFLMTEYAKNWRTRLRQNIIVQFTPYEELAEIPIATPHHEIQKAIGNKFRKAECLRKLAKNIQNKINEIIDNELDFDQKKEDVLGLSTWISTDNLGHRLDGKYNSPERVWILDHLKKYKIDFSPATELLEITAMIGWKGLTTEHYVEYGPYLIRGVDIEDGVLNFENLVRVDIDKYLEQPQIHLTLGDIVLTKDGTIGKAMTVPAVDKKMCAGSTVARLRNKTNIPSHYFESIFNHQVLQIQIQSFATGLAQPHITQEWIAELLIPIIPSVDEVDVLTRKHHNFLIQSKQYLDEAKSDIEALIDGTLDEEKLLSEGDEIEQWLKDNPSPYETGRKDI